MLVLYMYMNVILNIYVKYEIIKKNKRKDSEEVRKINIDDNIKVKVDSILIAADQVRISLINRKSTLESNNTDTEKLLNINDELSEKIIIKKVINTILSENDDNSNVVIVAHGMFNTYLILAATGLGLIPDFNFSATCKIEYSPIP